MIQRFEDFVTMITVCYKGIWRIKNMEMQEMGLKGSHVMCLYFLHRNPEGLTSAQLCQLCAEDKAAISRAVSSLLKMGYITYEGKKYRAKLRLTEVGLRIARQEDELICQWVGFCGDELTEEERDVFYRCLGKIAEKISLIKDSVKETEKKPAP